MMPEARIFDAAGPTVDFFHDTGEPTLVSATEERIVLRAEVQSGRLEGRIARIEWLGSFDIPGGEGAVGEIRESIAGAVHFAVTFGTPIDVGDLLTGDDPFEGGLRYFGNRFRNVMEGDLSGADLIRGEGGGDTVRGLGGPDRLYGGAGNDVLRGGAGDDRLSGGGGDDLLDGGNDNGRNLLFGGAGDDTYLDYVSTRGGAIITEQAGGGYDILRSFAQSASLPDHVEELRMEGRFANFVNALGNSGANAIHGSEGRDFVNGFGGSDVVFGRGGSDQLFGGNGVDRLCGGRGDDAIYDFHGRTRFAGGPGDDLLQTGSTARDVMTGDAGADRFVWETPAAAGLATADVVEDFTPGVDTLVLQYIDARSGQPGDQAFRFIGSADFSGRGAEIRYAGGVVLGAIDRDTEADFRIRLVGAPELAEDDILL